MTFEDDMKKFDTTQDLYLLLKKGEKKFKKDKQLNLHLDNKTMI